MMTAYDLATNGLQVAVFDKSQLAGESSWAGGGILTPLYPWRYAAAINQLAFRSQTLYPALVSRLKQDSGLDPEYCHSGMLISKADVDEGAVDWLNRHDVVYHEALPVKHQNLSNNDDYVFLPDICQVRNPRLSATLKLALQHQSVAIHEHCCVDDIVSGTDGFKLLTEQGQFSASKVVVSAGAWSGKILNQLGLSVSIKPVRGQMLLFKAPLNFLSAIVLAEGKYIIPRQDGHVLVGSTMEEVGFNKDTTQDALDDLMDFVRSRCPQLATYPVVKHWSGLRPASPQGIPYIFEDKTRPGLFVNTGHFRNGVVLAPASAELISDLVFERSSILEPEAYSIG